MKNSKKYFNALMKSSMLLLFGTLLFGGCQAPNTDTNTSTQTATCDAVNNIEGAYTCTGECIITKDGVKQVVKVSGEEDVINRYPGASLNLFEVNITGGNDFHELELGVLTGLTMRTATAKVSDGQYPVLEEYVFDTNALCDAVGFTKIVRNPTEAEFKTCVILCRKNVN